VIEPLLGRGGRGPRGKGEGGGEAALERTR